MFSLLFGLFEYLFRKEELHVLILGALMTVSYDTASCRRRCNRPARGTMARISR